MRSSSEIESIKQRMITMDVYDITDSYITGLFGKKYNAKTKKVEEPLIAPNTKIIIKKGEFQNDQDINTTIGRLLYNKLILSEDYMKHIGFQNITLTADNIKGIEAKLLTLTLDGKTPVEAFHRYLKRVDWLGMQFNFILGSSFSEATIKPIPSAMALKEKLIEENKKKLESGDLIAAVDLENKVLDEAKRVLKGDHGMDMYDSGARGSFNASYKPMFGITGPIYNGVEGKWDIVTSNLNDGIEKKDMSPYGNMVVSGAYPKAIGTGDAGYLSKELTAAFQDAVLDPPGSDCGTTGYLETILTPWLASQSNYAYIVEGNKLVLLNQANMNQYIGKKVKLRTPIYCKSENICSVCAGAIFHKLGITNMGLTVPRVSSTILNLSMKKFHATNAKTTTLNTMDLIL